MANLTTPALFHKYYTPNKSASTRSIQLPITVSVIILFQTFEIHPYPKSHKDKPIQKLPLLQIKANLALRAHLYPFHKVPRNMTSKTTKRTRKQSTSTESPY